MNFKSFIKEELSPEDIINTLQRDCSMFIDEVGSTGLYRGIKEPPTGLLNKIVPRTDRYPKHTPIQLQNAFNQVFEEIYGVKDIRSRAVFCAGTEQNNYYGHMYRIFPIGHYEYWWSPRVNDLFEFMQDREFLEQGAEGLRDFLAKYKYQDTELLKALKKYKFNEIMLLCDSYYAISVDEVELLQRIDNEFQTV